MHINRKERILSIHRLPRGYQWFAATLPRGIRRVDQARVVREFGPGDDIGVVGAGARVGVVQLDHAGVVEVCYADVAAGLAAVFAVCWGGVDERVVGSAVGLDFGG